MTMPQDRPRLRDQPMEPHGVWRARLDAFMSWEPANDDYSIAPVGPLVPQDHDSGSYLPGAGNVMTWKDAAPIEDAPVLLIVDIPGDEDQGDAEVVDEIEQAQ